MSVKNERGRRYRLELYRSATETNKVTFNLRHVRNLSLLCNSKSRDHANIQIAHHYPL